MPKTVTVSYPSHPGSPGLPAIAATPTEVLQVANSAWTTHSRSINEIVAGSFIETTFRNGVSGGFLGFSTQGMDGRQLAGFLHGVMCDTSGLWVFESGEKVHKLMDSYADVLVRIVRQQDDTVVYTAVGLETKIYRSTKCYNLPMYGYGYLYSAGDTVSSARIATGNVQFASA